MHIQELLRHRMAVWPWVWERGARYMVTRSQDSSACYCCYSCYRRNRVYPRQTEQ